MNVATNAMSETFESQVIATAKISVARRMYWALRRELWENRYLYWAPLAVGGVTLFGFLIATIGRAMAVPSLAQRLAVLEEPYTFVALLIMGTIFIVGIFYSLEALHGERRDRSILFWKSLPVSDLITVLAKACIPLLFLPLLGFAITIVAQFVMLLLSSVVVLGSGLSISSLWAHVSLFRTSLMLLYHIFTVHVLWSAPIYGWLLLVSAWARRAPIIWAALPPFAIGALEKIAFNTTHFAAMLQHRLEGGPEAITVPGSMPTDPMTQLTPLRFLSSPGLWIGLGIFAAFLTATVRLRRYRGPV
jgi:ABC-2 type transport system permease protein